MKQKRSGMNKISPVGLATTALVANQVSVLATYNEKLCRPYCVNGNVQPQASITYSYEQPILNGTTVFVPIVATISIISPVVGSRNVIESTAVDLHGKMGSSLPRADSPTNGCDHRQCRTDAKG